MKRNGRGFLSNFSGERAFRFPGAEGVSSLLSRELG